MRWSENETYHFVKIYLSHEYLWNPDHPCYRMKNKRQKAYKDISTEFNAVTGLVLHEIEVKMKIKNLRSTYVQELAKIKNRSCPDSVYTPAMKWFAEWHKHFSVMGRSKYDVDIPVNDEDETPDDTSQKIWVSTGEDNEEETSIDPFSAQNHDDYVILLKSEPKDEYQKHQSDLCDLNNKKKSRRSPSEDNSDRTYRGSLDSNLDSHIREDEFDIYGKYIATQLRKMDLQKALKVQLEIQNIVSEARLSCLASE
ncbi:uncharacterized protein LOC113516099 [Galleria mellonella]|uniref:Uncharacterized protein LOC113516099 n=1 Tax=Galleria mellonella TaxID=7137 RepID=A0A6J1WUK5_GALME|nr:uncharacterized protein LOC113516099 [Galleria mellonella]